jgi:hypothetical protein
LDDEDACPIGYPKRCEGMANGVHALEAAVNCHFEDCGCGIKRAVDDPLANAVPTPPKPKGPFPTVPSRGKLTRIDAPAD